MEYKAFKFEIFKKMIRYGWKNYSKRGIRFPIKILEHRENIQYSGCPMWRRCKKCGSLPDDHELRNFDRMWGDGDVYCLKCGTRVRSYDSG